MTLFRHELSQGSFSVSLKEENLWFTKQKHGSTIQNINSVKKENKILEGDGIFWRWDEITSGDKLAVYTADCLPIALEGTRGGAILHAGWRGVHQKIHCSDILKGLGIKQACIGPSIQMNSFQVTEEFYEHFPASPFFKTQAGKIFFDLQSQVIKDLEENFPDIKIFNSKICTYEQAQYNSYRRDGTTKRNYNIYQLKES